jgi:quinol monooxygenase YgiN
MNPVSEPPVFRLPENPRYFVPCRRLPSAAQAADLTNRLIPKKPDLCTASWRLSCRLPLAISLAQDNRMILFSLRVLVSASSRDDFLKGVGALLEPTRVAPGCLGCRLYSEVDRPEEFLLVEEWASQPALDRHLASDACKTLVAAMEMALQCPIIRFDEVARSAGIEVIEAARRAQGLLQDLPHDACENER